MKERIKEALDAMETACAYIIDNVAPGTHGKVDAVMELRHTAHRLVQEYATHKIGDRNHERSQISVS